eukprot:comp21500_c0_seq2/m.29812 comp21500_c0_seq2/g.29812  ORF comp21500_c0_seq2/g.29812 comp21500_c0_seq2/m.29812 type:complete len:236 (-) comp21500_c0_seq2:766-1473(-)
MLNTFVLHVQVKRKAGSTETNRPKSETLKRVLQDMQAIQEQQGHVQEKLENLETDNKLMWGEMSKLKSRHQLQQQTINRILYFLTSIYAPDRLYGGKDGNKITSLDDPEGNKLNGTYRASIGGPQDPNTLLGSPAAFHQATAAEATGFFNSLGDLIGNNNRQPSNPKTPTVGSGNDANNGFQPGVGGQHSSRVEGQAGGQGLSGFQHMGQPMGGKSSVNDYSWGQPSAQLPNLHN